MKRVLIFIWRIWFYVAIFIAIVLTFPFILINAQRDTRYPVFFRWARVWGWLVLLISGFRPKVTWLEKPDKDGVYIVCPNHTSMIDIMLTFAIFPNCFVFIGKKELASLPLFGYFYRKTNILVDRSSIKSRQRAFEQGSEKLREGIGLCIFPEGGVPDPKIDLARFKAGAFKLAVQHQVPIIPVSYPDNKRHLPYDLTGGKPGRLRAIVHPFLYPQAEGDAEAERLKEACYEAVWRGLELETKEELINEIG